MNVDGRWRIVEMELWDREAIELLGPAFFKVGPGHQGSFRFIAVKGWMDIRAVDGSPDIEFSWKGRNECDEASGRGWATLSSDGSLTGRIYFHGGDDSGFRAVRPANSSQSCKRR